MLFVAMLPLVLQHFWVVFFVILWQLQLGCWDWGQSVIPKVPTVLRDCRKLIENWLTEEEKRLRWEFTIF